MAESDATSSISGETTTLTEVVTRLRRALRTSIRTDCPWESLPIAQVELLLALIGDALDRLVPGERATVSAALPALALLVDHLASPDLDAADADGRTGSADSTAYTDTPEGIESPLRSSHVRRQPDRRHV